MDREDRIRERAYEIWISDGRPEGREKEHWEQAASEVGNTGQEAEQDAAEGEASTSPGSEVNPSGGGTSRRRVA